MFVFVFAYTKTRRCAGGTWTDHWPGNRKATLTAGRYVRDREPYGGGRLRASERTPVLPQPVPQRRGKSPSTGYKEGITRKEKAAYNAASSIPLPWPTTLYNACTGLTFKRPWVRNPPRPPVKTRLPGFRKPSSLPLYSKSTAKLIFRVPTSPAPRRGSCFIRPSEGR